MKLKLAGLVVTATLLGGCAVYPVGYGEVAVGPPVPRVYVAPPPILFGPHFYYHRPWGWRHHGHGHGHWHHRY